MGKAASSMLTMSYKDADEKDLRDKLVTKLKQKAADKMAHCDKRLKKKREKRRRLHELDDDDDDRSGDENEDTENDEVGNILSKITLSFKSIFDVWACFLGSF